MEPAIYGHSQPLNMPGQIGTGESDDGADAATVDGHHHHHHIQFETHTLEDGSGGFVVEDVSSDAVHGHGGDGASELALQQHCDDSSQLTLSFRGQVYVFDSVTPEKVPFYLIQFPLSNY